MDFTSNAVYPSIGESIQLTCSINTRYPLEIRRPGNGPEDAICGSCPNITSPGQIRSDCLKNTTAKYSITCDWGEEGTTMVFGITGVTKKEIGPVAVYMVSRGIAQSYTYYYHA